MWFDRTGVKRIWNSFIWTLTIMLIVYQILATGHP